MLTHENGIKVFDRSVFFSALFPSFFSTARMSCLEFIMMSTIFSKVPFRQIALVVCFVRSCISEGIHVPVRPAPAPPPGKLSHNKQNNGICDGWTANFSNYNGKSNLPQRLPQIKRAGGKKTPPPRPPPPKITFNQKNGRTQPQRPSQLLSSLGDIFSRDRTNRQAKTVSPLPMLPPPTKNDSVSLIDLNSPPSSPTPTTRSSSDGLSVDSFGSDSTFSHSGRHNQVESGFEDDFDFFSGFPTSSATATPSPIIGPIDPFSPPKPVKSVSPAATQSPVLPRPSGFSNPTIIRPKIPLTYAKPANSQMRLPNAVFQSGPVQPDVEVTQSSFDSGSFELEENRSPSPPMPSIPAPVLPPEVLAKLDNSNITSSPCGVALYDYAASHPDDLWFKEGDNIELVRKINEEWLYGRTGGREGIFPSNFIQVVNLLPDSDDTEEPAFMATALYPFIAETWEDLDFKEGARVKVLSKIDADWLFGECEGRRGQFPTSFIDVVPQGLPHKSS